MASNIDSSYQVPALFREEKSCTLLWTNPLSQGHKISQTLMFKMLCIQTSKCKTHVNPMFRASLHFLPSSASVEIHLVSISFLTCLLCFVAASWCTHSFFIDFFFLQKGFCSFQKKKAFFLLPLQKVFYVPQKQKNALIFLSLQTASCRVEKSTAHI